MSQRLGADDDEGEEEDEQAMWRRLLLEDPICDDSMLLPYLAAEDEQQQQQQQQHAAAVPVVDASRLSPAAFVARFMAPNRPVLLRGACRGWRACSEWVCAHDGAPDVAAIAALAPGATAPVTDAHPRHEGAGPCEDMSLAAYAAWWQEHHHRQTNAQQEQQQQPRVDQQRQPALPPPSAAAEEGHAQAPPPHQPHQHHQPPHQQQPPLPYLKDFHLAAELPGGRGAYTVPPFFADDWLNEWCDAQAAASAGQRQRLEHQRDHQEPPNGGAAADGADVGGGGGGSGDDGDDTQAAASKTTTSSGRTADYRFLYVGPHGSWTPLHSDVLRSFSWSANVCGAKRWRLLPPHATRRLLLPHGGGDALPCDFPPAAGVDASSSSGDAAAATTAEVVKVLQLPGDALFVPSGWHHVVTNASPGGTLSINHNWLNGHNAHWAWALLRAERRQAVALIEDCRANASPAEFEALVQRMLAANAGLDWEGFAGLLACVARRRLLRQRAAMEEVAAGGGGGGATAVARLRLAFDLRRAARLLGQVAAAAGEVAAANAAWARKHAPAQVKGDAAAAAAPAWAAEAAALAAEAELAVEQLTKAVAGGAHAGVAGNAPSAASLLSSAAAEAAPGTTAAAAERGEGGEGG